MNINSLLIGFKREYWENKRIIWGIPLILSVLIFLGATLSTVAEKYEANSSNNDTAPSAKLVPDNNSSKSVKTSTTEAQPSKQQKNKKPTYGFIGIYIAIAWLTACYYLLGSLYNDRKDKSILYWKSLPVSETQQVLTKLFMGTIGFAAISLCIALITAIALTLFGLIDQTDFVRPEQTSFLRISILMLLGIIISAIWAAPLFAYILMISAVSKRAPFLLLILPIFTLVALEAMFLKDSNLISSIVNRTPFKPFRSIAYNNDLISPISHYLIENSTNLIFGFVIAAGFIAVTIWCRNYRFEI